MRKMYFIKIHVCTLVKNLFIITIRSAADMFYENNMIK